MTCLTFDKEALTLTDLREQFTVDVSGGIPGTISVDMYGPEGVHPSDHFGYWNHKLPAGDSKISIGINLAPISFNSVKLTCNGKKMIYSDHWINTEFIFSGRLDIAVTLWSGDKSTATRKFEVKLNDETRQKLQQALGNMNRLGKNARFIDHFCNEEIPPPKLLVIESTSRCNLKCEMCPRTIDSSPSGEYGDLDENFLPNVESTIRNTSSVCLSWMGEPLLNKRLPEIIRRIRTINPGVHISLTSNGMLLSEETAHTLIDSGLDSVNISIDAADPTIYRKIRVGAELETVKANIRTLNRLKDEHAVRTPAIGIAYVAGETNIRQMPDLVSLAADLGVTNVSLTMMDDFTLTAAYRNRMSLNDGIREQGREAFARTELAAREKNITLTYEMPLQFFNFLGISRSGYEVEPILLDNEVSDEQIRQLGLQKGCQVPWQDAFIAHNGDVHPCCVSPRVLGSLGRNTFEEIWNGRAYREFRRRLKSDNTNEECRRCRRAIWNKTAILEGAKDWMEVGRAELHGLGWGGAGTDRSGKRFRFVSRKATFFLRNSGKPYLAIALGNEGRNIADCRILLNSTEIDVVSVPYGWQTGYFNISGFINTDDLFRVDLVITSSNTQIKITGAWLLAEEELDERMRSAISRRKLVLHSLLNKSIALIKQCRFYSDKLKHKLQRN